MRIDFMLGGFILSFEGAGGRFWEMGFIQGFRDPRMRTAMT